MGALQRIGSGLSHAPRVVFPDGGDPRVVEAAQRLAAGRSVKPILLGREAPSSAPVEWLDPSRSPLRAEYETRCAQLRGLPPAHAHRLLERPLYFALMMLREGAADAMVAGVGTATGEVLVACRSMLGLARPDALASSVFALEVPGFREPPDDLLLLADCAVNPSPGAEELSRIAEQAADAAVALLAVEPKVALLSFSTHGSASHPDAEKVAAAAGSLKRRRPQLHVDGELQADAALDDAAAAHTGAGAGDVAGRANVLVFPDLDAGNIGYKLVRSLARANAYGVFLQGFSKPVAKLSRGARAEEIFGTALLLARLAGKES